MRWQDNFETTIQLLKWLWHLTANGRSIQVTGLAWSLAIIDCSRNVGKIVTDKHNAPLLQHSLTLTLFLSQPWALIADINSSVTFCMNHIGSAFIKRF